MVEPVNLFPGKMRLRRDQPFQIGIVDPLEAVGNEVNSRLEAGIIPADELSPM